MSIFLTSSVAHAKLEFTPSQYHIQTDEGDRRFFKYQTWSGQYRKETRLDDGSVVGSYGWIDANGILRVYEYVADDRGYRITKDRAFQVQENATTEGQISFTQPIAEKNSETVPRLCQQKID